MTRESVRAKIKQHKFSVRLDEIIGISSDEVFEFVASMYLKLSANAYKGDSWKKVPVEWLSNGLLNHAISFHKKHDRRELLDIANYTLFLHLRTVDKSFSKVARRPRVKSRKAD